MLRFAVVLSVAAMCAASGALADEAIQTHSSTAPVAPEAPASTVSPEQAQRQADGDWARGVMAGADAEARGEKKPADTQHCQRNPDRNPHGEAWAGVGSGGYSEFGVVVTQPIGDCGQVTVAASQAQGGAYARRGPSVPRGPRR